MKRKIGWRSFLSIPLWIAVLGVCTTIVITRVVKSSEEDREKNLSFQRGTDLIDRVVLVYTNSVLRIQSHDELFEIQNMKVEASSAALQRALQNTIFSRMSLFEMTKPPGQGPPMSVALPELERVAKIDAGPDEAFPYKHTLMQSEDVKRAIVRLMRANIIYQTLIYDFRGTTILSVVWKLPFAKRNFIVFSCYLQDLFKDVYLRRGEQMMVRDPFSGGRWRVSSGSTADDKKIISSLGSSTQLQDLPDLGVSEDDVFAADLRPIFQFVAAPADSSTFSLYKITFLVGLVLTSLVTYLFWLLLMQNNTISRLVVQKTFDLETANHNLQEALLAKSRFLANVSHEIRTPLNLIIGMIELSEERATDPKQANYLASIRMAGDHLLGMVEDILDVSKPEFQSVEVRVRRINTIQFLDEIGKIITPLCLDHNLQFYLVVDPDVPEYFESDPSRLRQILLNLLRNATKYTPTGHVALRVYAATQTQGKEVIRFEVQDTGVGIPKDRLGQIFEAFFQLESAKILAAGGVGLGLSIVRDLVSQLKGEIHVVSRVGHGSTFSVDMSKVNASSQPWVCSFFMPNHVSKTLVIVSDDPHFLEPLSFLKSFEELKTVAIRSNEVSEFPVHSIKTESIEVILDGKIPKSKSVQNFVESLNAERVIVVSDKLKSDFRFKVRTESIDARPLSPFQLLQALGFKSRTRERVQVKAAFDSNPSRVLPLKQVPPQPLQPLSVLIADDDAGNRELYRAYFENLPWTLRFAKNGREALDLFKDSPAEIVIADLRMPEMDGFCLIENIRAFESEQNRAAAQVILVTADALEETAERARSYSSTLYMTKPVRKKNLIAAVQKLAAPA